MKTKIKPKSLVLYLTKRCNSRCPYCVWMLREPNFFHTKSEFDMPLEKAKEIIDYYYYNIGVRIIRLQSEGEILLYKHLEELTFYCKKKGFNKDGWNFSTNGIILNKYIDFILNYFSVIAISVDGHNAETFIRHRGGNEAIFNKVINNIRKLSSRKKKRNRKTTIWINCIIHSDDYKKVFPMIKLAENLGVDKIRFGNFHPIEGGKGLQPVSSEQIQYLSGEINKGKYRVGVKLPRLYKAKYPFYCAMLFNVVLVGSEYNFAPCCRINSDSHWGAFSDKAKHNSENLKKLRKCFIKAKVLSDLPKCCQQCGRLKTKKK